MAVEQLSQTPAGTTDFTLLKNEVTKNAKGINPISLSNYDNDLEPVVYIGSVFENNGATFIVTDSDITPTGYSGISNGNTFYLYYDESANTFIYDSIAPVWNSALHGFYNGNDRAFFSLLKDSGGTLYQNKNLLVSRNNMEFSNDVKIGNDLTVGENITYSGEILPIGSIEGVWSFDNSMTVPRGHYMYKHESNGASTATDLEIRTSATWRVISTGFTGNAGHCLGGFIDSDGSNVRLTNNGGTSNVHYLKF